MFAGRGDKVYKKVDAEVTDLSALVVGSQLNLSKCKVSVWGGGAFSAKEETTSIQVAFYPEEGVWGRLTGRS